MPIEDVVAQDQCGMILPDKLAADDKRLRQPVGRRLHRVLQIKPPIGAAAEQPFKPRCVVRS